MSDQNTTETPTPAAAERVCCPSCGSEQLQEIAYRYTWQPVEGLTRDGQAEDYHEFDYGDDPQIIGYGCCDCGWEHTAEPVWAENAFADALAALATVQEKCSVCCEPEPQEGLLLDQDGVCSECREDNDNEEES